MITFYSPTYSCNSDDEYAHIVAPAMCSFDELTFMRGRPFDGAIPGDVRLPLSDGKLGDYMSTHLCWYIFSDRAADMITRRAGDSVQFFDAPLFRCGTGEGVGGYKLMNATRAIRCIDFAKADVVFRSREPMDVDRVRKWVFDGSIIPKDLHVFHAAEYRAALYFSEQLMEEMMSVEPPFKDLAFLEYGGGDEVVTIRRVRKG